MNAAPTEVACACRNSYPFEPDRQGEHVSLANKLLGVFLFLTLSAFSTLLMAATTDERSMRQGSSEVEPLLTDNPSPEIAEGQAAAAPPDSRCTKQLKQGYALKERIDNEYRQSRRDGTFRARSDEFTARWGEEAGQWADETRALLLQIGGPTAKSRFQNAKTPIGMVSGDVRWNNIRNFLRTRLAALASICKAP
jgi:hypothetical protein